MKVSLNKRFTLSDAERRFRRACDQIVLLNQKLGEVQKRYKNARSTNNRSFRYNLRLKLAVVEGVRNMYYDYAYAKADQVADLRTELFNESVEIVSGSDSDYMSDTEQREYTMRRFPITALLRATQISRKKAIILSHKPVFLLSRV